MGVIERSRELTAHFPEKTLGHIALCLEPVSSMLTLEQAMEYFLEDDLITSLPVERNDRVMGLLSREAVLEKKHSTWEKLKNPTLEHYCEEDSEIFDSRENCQAVVSRLMNRPAEVQNQDLIVFHNRRYFGIVPIRRLMQHVAELKEREITYARELQNFLVRRTQAEAKTFSYDVHLDMCHELGGDFYQSVQLSKDLALIACFDVSGKNVAASLTTSIISSFFSTLEVLGELSNYTTGEILRSLNNVLARTTPLDVFTAALIYCIDTANDTVSIYNFGYSKVFIISVEGGKAKMTTLDPTLRPLGIEEMETVDELDQGKRELKIRKNLKFFSYSDGLIDLEDPMGRKFGQEQVDDFIKKNFSLKTKDFIAAARSKIEEYKGEAPQTDDITVLALQF